ncbi:uncharacterized protein LOC124927400 [Impatiens glandulifera]|uniref:uncharacterized protein LOC124927400 n=1 Tax=Impatiens glandulifera TaxID=253017 RepID=UPI001FB0E1E2|nr:uncharacterized protein LOC124927400 [Impatiens glandulifera]XP_047323763.1 uncharacterized protein LOC124927400 [Impatiens glandulifera]
MNHTGAEENISELKKKKKKKKMHQTYLDFLARVQLLNEIAVVGHRYLVGFHQRLDVLCQSSINKTSDVVERLLQSNESKRIISYVEAGCKTLHNTTLYMRSLHTCHLGLQDYLNKAKDIVVELECLVNEATSTIQTADEGELELSEEEIVPYDNDNDNDQEPEITYYATTMSILYSMVKQDYTMKMRIISSLTLKTTSEELESYTKLWQLQPFIDDDLLNQAVLLIKDKILINKHVTDN